MLQHTDTPGESTCREHPGTLFTSEEAGVRHLQAEHPDLWSWLGRTEATTLNNRQERRHAAKAARAAQRAVDAEARRRAALGRI